jgi:hypothetical protein
MRPSTIAIFAGAAVFASACGAGGIRPSYPPLPNARVDTINAAPAAVIQELVTQVNSEQMRPEWSSPSEGYLVTQWFNVVTQESGKMDRNNLDRIIRLRFWADPIGENKTKLTSEAVMLGNTDVSKPERDRELEVPPDHAADRLRTRAIDAVIERFGK